MGNKNSLIILLFFINGIFEKSALVKSFDNHYDALFGSAPAAMASPGCDCPV
jgi:hypothetical protein